MSLSRRFSKKEVKDILTCTKKIRTLIKKNMKRCNRISEEIKTLMKEYKDLTKSLAVVSVKYQSHKKNAPSTVYHRRRAKRQRILEECATEYLDINDKLAMTSNLIGQIKKSVELIATDHTDIINLQNDVLTLLSARLGENELSEIKTAWDLNNS